MTGIAKSLEFHTLEILRFDDIFAVPTCTARVFPDSQFPIGKRFAREMAERIRREDSSRCQAQPESPYQARNISPKELKSEDLEDFPVFRRSDFVAVGQR
jgi:hypothetical protein